MKRKNQVLFDKLHRKACLAATSADDVDVPMECFQLCTQGIRFCGGTGMRYEMIFVDAKVTPGCLLLLLREPRARIGSMIECRHAAEGES